MVKVKSVMRKNVITVEPKFTLAAIAKIMANNRVGSVVIMDKKRPRGIVTSEDIVSIISRGRKPSAVKAQEYINRAFVTALPEDDLLKVVKKMVKKKIKRVPVIRGGKLHGILTDKEILLTAPEMIGILSEKLKMRVERVAKPDDVISGICEMCEGYSDNLHFIGGRWVCETCGN
jgi:CBS domain-containing protein